MAKQKTPLGTDEESRQRTTEYHRGDDNSIRNVMRSIKDDQDRQGVALSGVDDEDIDEIKEPPEPGRAKIKEPPPPKPSR